MFKRRKIVGKYSDQMGSNNNGRKKGAMAAISNKAKITVETKGSEKIL